ncbi:MAG TPA: hypothetical protein VJB96_05210 [Patescibacteria group bacterium]|nr:hypothetical protein [Patescibacteria group bacterium]
MAEITPKMEKEPGRARRVVDRIGKFLSETYTVKGAKAAELRKYEKLYASFTPSQQQEMMAYYDKKAGKKAVWKVVRNWVATGAGLALGWGLLQPGGAAAMWKWAVESLNVMGIQFQPVDVQMLLNPPLPTVPKPVGVETWLPIPFVEKITKMFRRP